MTLQTFQPKELIFREDEPGEAAYIIRSGQVEILKHAEHGEVQLAVLETGDVFGEMALFEPRNTRSASARALNTLEVEVITDDAFRVMLGQVPETMQKMVGAIMMRLRDTNQRLATRERATVVLDGAIEKIILRPGSDRVVFEPVELLAANLPYSIGGYPQGEESPRHNDLDLPTDGPPLMISQKHLRLERRDGEVYAVDMGARFCTIVNGKVIGRGKVDTKAQLQIGENRITLGDHTSPYKLILECS